VHFDTNVVLELVAPTGFYHLVSFLVNAAGVGHEPSAERFPSDIGAATTSGE
jgi:hypothetical protein